MRRVCMFSLAGRVVLFSIVLCILFVVADGSGLNANPTQPCPLTSLGPENIQSTAITDALQAAYGSVVEAETGFAPFYLTGDFNGDASEDIVIVVHIKERRATLPKDVQLLNPFWYGPRVTFPKNPAVEKPLALAIIHKWKTPQSAAKFLLVGQAPLLIFRHDITSDPNSAKNLMKLMTKRGKRPSGVMFPRLAKGDVILLWTEVGDETPLYWTGRTYKWEEGSAD